jgi:hypothetical protein
MKKAYLFSIFVLLSSCGIIPSIYNEGTAGRMPRNLKVSDFYYDIESLYEYGGLPQDYLKVKSFFWQDPQDTNHTIESAFFIVKFHSHDSSPPDYRFEYRRYEIIDNEEPYSDTIKNMWFDNDTEIQRGATLYLEHSGNNRFRFGMPHRTGWACSDGLYEKYKFDINIGNISQLIDEIFQHQPLFEHIIHISDQFEFNLPSENIETNGFQLTDTELKAIKKNGNLAELENNKFLLTAKELEDLKTELPKLIAKKRRSNHAYREQSKSELLK